MTRTCLRSTNFELQGTLGIGDHELSRLLGDPSRRACNANRVSGSARRPSWSWAGPNPSCVPITSSTRDLVHANWISVAETQTSYLLGIVLARLPYISVYLRHAREARAHETPAQQRSRLRVSRPLGSRSSYVKPPTKPARPRSLFQIAHFTSIRRNTLWLISIIARHSLYPLSKLDGPLIPSVPFRD